MAALKLALNLLRKPAVLSGGEVHASCELDRKVALTTARLNRHCSSHVSRKPLPASTTRVAPPTGPDVGLKSETERGG